MIADNEYEYFNAFFNLPNDPRDEFIPLELWDMVRIIPPSEPITKNEIETFIRGL